MVKAWYAFLNASNMGASLLNISISWVSGRSRQTSLLYAVFFVAVVGAALQTDGTGGWLERHSPCMLYVCELHETAFYQKKRKGGQNACAGGRQKRKRKTFLASSLLAEEKERRAHGAGRRILYFHLYLNYVKFTNLSHFGTSLLHMPPVSHAHILPGNLYVMRCSRNVVGIYGAFSYSTTPATFFYYHCTCPSRIASCAHAHTLPCAHTYPHPLYTPCPYTRTRTTLHAAARCGNLPWLSMLPLSSLNIHNAFLRGAHAFSRAPFLLASETGGWWMVDGGRARRAHRCWQRGNTYTTIYIVYRSDGLTISGRARATLKQHVPGD